MSSFGLPSIVTQWVYKPFCCNRIVTKNGIVTMGSREFVNHRIIGYMENEPKYHWAYHFNGWESDFRLSNNRDMNKNMGTNGNEFKQ